MTQEDYTERLLRELSYPNEEFLTFLNTPDNRTLLFALLDADFPWLLRATEPIIDEVYHWIYLVHDDFIREQLKE